MAAAAPPPLRSQVPTAAGRDFIGGESEEAHVGPAYNGPYVYRAERK